jgi:ubiquinone biosynthesis accessory factor UbiJ
MSLPQLFIASIETAFNRYLSLDPDALSRFEDMEGKVIEIKFKGLNESLFLFPGMDGIMVMSDFDAEADTILSGTPMALARLSLSKNAAPVLFSGEVVITGDARLGHQFKKILSQLDIDWEEQLSRYVGDLVAHQVGNTFRDISSWFSRSKDSMFMDAGEYLQEESRLIPAQAEIDRFNKQVDSLRDATERLQVRIKNLVEK